MMGPDLAELLIEGVRVTVRRQAALDLFERNRVLLLAGRIETARVDLVGGASEVLHLIVGAAPLALLTSDAAGDDSPDPDVADVEQVTAAEAFLDFDQYVVR